MAGLSLRKNPLGEFPHRDEEVAPGQSPEGKPGRRYFRPAEEKFVCPGWDCKHFLAVMSRL
jgi:hypothetical protein